MSLGSKAVGDEFVNGQERSFAVRKPIYHELKNSFVSEAQGLMGEASEDISA